MLEIFPMALKKASAWACSNGHFHGQCTACGCVLLEDVICEVDAQTAADVAPVVHGRWLQKKHKIFGNAYDYVCSECGCDYALAEYNYCPNCGAKMDGGANNEAD